MILTSHDRLGDTGKQTGFWLEELRALTPLRHETAPVTRERITRVTGRMHAAFYRARMDTHIAPCPTA